jgi:integrase
MWGIVWGIKSPQNFWLQVLTVFNHKKDVGDMAKQERIKTSYPGVLFIEGRSVANPGKPERIYYIRYRKDGKAIEEKIGRQFVNDMTPAKAARIRAKRIQKDEFSNEKRGEAEREEREAEAGRYTIARLWEEYKNLKGAYPTLKTDISNFKHLETLGDKEPYEIAKLDVDRLRLKLSKSKSSQTVKHVLVLLKRIVNFGANRGISEALKFKIEMPRLNNEKTEDLTSDQLSRLLQAIEDDEHVQAGNMMKMALFTGMRRGEMFKLKWDDIDYQRGFIHLKDPKGGPDQKIPLNDPARELFLSHPKTDSAYVFPGRNGNQRTDIKHQVNRIKEKAELPKNFRALHGLRHVYASMLASSGQVDLYTLQKLLTHKHPAMTQRYAHLRDEALRKASDLAGNIIERAANGENKIAGIPLPERA